MQTPQITVIMPVYNAAQSLARAVEGILSQSVAALELLLVDDGSTDGSGDLCRAFARNDPRVRALHQENAGICAARNHGLRCAKGRYITFCDDDDLLLPNALQTLLNLAEKNAADVARTGYRLLREGADGTLRELPHPAGAACTARRGRDAGRDYGAFLRSAGPQFVWNALYRRDVLENITFPAQCRHGLEDFVFNTAVYAVCATLAYDPACTYEHYERADSTSVCQAQTAVDGRVRALPLWAEGEYRAVCRWCGEAERPAVWNERKAQLITFLMHQLRDAAAAPAVQRRAWQLLRTTLNRYPHTRLDFLRIAGQNKKQMLAMLLYTTHLQGLYPHLS